MADVQKLADAAEVIVQGYAFIKRIVAGRQPWKNVEMRY